MQCGSQTNAEVIGVDLPECDITCQESVDQTFEKAGPLDVVVNAAAYTAVDLAESNAQTAYAVNRDGAEHLSVACRQHRVPLIHISTDYVFEGLQTRPYKPDDPVSPRGVYAKSKSAGEDIVRQLLVQHLIIRVSWLFGLYGNNFVKTMLRLGKEREEVKVVDDQIGSPTYARDLAKSIFQICGRISTGLSAWGTYHFSNQGALTWYAFARKIFLLAGKHEDLAVRNVLPILTAHYPTPAPRPHYSVLDCTRFDQTFGVSRRPWDKALKEMLADLYATSIATS